MLSLISATMLAVVVGVILVVAAGLSLVTPPLRDGPVEVVVAGFAAGVMGTAGAVGGPALGIALQNRPAPVLRSTLAVSFVLGTVISLAALIVSGHVEGRHAAYALLLSPAMVIGLWISRYTARFVSGPWVRPAVLALAAVAGVVTAGTALVT